MQDDERDVELEAETDADMQRGSAHGDAEHKVNKLKEEIEHIKKERQEYLDGWQRSKADYVNLLKRSQQQTDDSKQAGIIKAVETLLPAFDALERAKEHMSSEASAREGGEGFLAIARQLENGFAELGLVAVGQVGERFDPVLHEAIGADPVSDSAADGTVTAVLERGWKIEDRVIRPAKVRVAHYIAEA